MNKKGIANIGVLIGILVFLLVVFVAALPLINASLLTNSASLASLGSSTPAILITIPLFLLLGAVAMIAFGLLTG